MTPRSGSSRRSRRPAGPSQEQPPSDILERVAETSPTGIAIIGADGHIRYANRRAEEILGLSKADIAARTYDAPAWRITALDGGPFPADQMPVARVLATARPVLDVRHAIAWPDGRRVLLSINAAPLPDAAGGVTGVVAVFEDITAAQRDRDVLQMQRLVLESIATGVALEITLEQLARALERLEPGMLASILLLDPDGSHVRHGAAPSLPDSFLRAIDGQAIGPRAGSCGTAMFRGEPVIVTDIAADPLWEAYRSVALGHGLRACWSTPVFDEQRRVLGSFAMYYRERYAPSEAHRRLIEVATSLAAVAISRERADTALRESERQLRRFIAAAPLAVAMFDRHMRYIAHSDRWIADYGLAGRGILGRSHYDVFPEIPDRWREVHRRALDGETLVADADPFLRSDGSTQWIRWDVRPWRTTEGAIGGIVIMSEDVTERLAAERQLRESRERLRGLAAGLERAREAERTRIARELHDELGQVLTGLKLDLAWLTGRLPQDEELRQRGAAMTQLLDDAVAAGRRIAAELRPGVLDDLGLAAGLRWLAREFSRRSGVVVETDVPDDLPVDGERATAVFRIAQEALTNAGRHAAASRIVLTAGVADGILKLVVADNGRGITPEQLAGAGSLGLLGMRERAAGWGGELAVAAAPGGGTRVALRLPLVSGA